MACSLESIRLKNILSFKDVKLPLDSLNVLIGPNAAGKSNLIDIIAWLENATKATRKGKYDKTDHAPRLLGLIDPALVREACPNCGRIFDTFYARLHET